MTGVPRWIVGILGLAALKIAAGIVGLLFGSPVPATAGQVGPHPLVSATIVFAFAGAGVLLVAGRRDLRAIYLGGCFLLGASSFAVRLALRLSSAPSPLDAVPGVVARLAPDAFNPLFFWLFVREFPHAHGNYRLNRIVRYAIRAAAVIGALLFVWNLFMPPVLVPDGRAGGRSGGGFYAILLPFSAAALPVMLLKARTARASERRRLRLFLSAIVMGAGPVAIEVLLEALVPRYHRFVTQPSVNIYYAVVIYALLIFLPFATSYAVLVQRVVELRLVVRRALQYALARYTVIGLASVPFAIFVWYVYRQRARTVADLFSGTAVGLMIGAAVGAVALARARRVVLDALDRRFFRERYDSRRALWDLARRISATRSHAELAAMVRDGIDAVLHVERVDLIVADPSGRMLVSAEGGAAPLSTSSMLARLLVGSNEPLEVDLENAGSALARLPQADRQWLADTGCQLLVPICGEGMELLGMLALGEKKSELPFDAEDRSLLAAVAASASLNIERRLLRTPGARRPASSDETDREHQIDVETPALECMTCGGVYGPEVPLCPGCQRELVPAAVPGMLARKFRFERRLGAGGMGVVYAATDLSLNRAVAIKTLPRISPEAAIRLRREAHAAARVIHPHLATIYGVEAWYGRPMLIFELLDGGTLSHRLRHGVLRVEEVVELGIAFADALHHAHAAGVLHGDVKPSNIGFRRSGIPKLMDFGVARMLNEAGDIPGHEPALADSVPTSGAWHAGGTATTGLVGTLAYLSPEVVRGESPDPAVDLWSLAIVLYESLTGRNPVVGATSLDTMISIRDMDIEDVRVRRPEIPSGLAAFMLAALSRDRGRRPSTAREFRDRLAAAGGTQARVFSISA